MRRLLLHPPLPRALSRTSFHATRCRYRRPVARARNACGAEVSAGASCVFITHHSPRVQCAGSSSWRALYRRARSRGVSAEERWGCNRAAVASFLSQSGGRYPSRRSTCADEARHSSWVARQRLAHRGGPADSHGNAMDSQRVASLELLAGWAWEPTVRKRWRAPPQNAASNYRWLAPSRCSGSSDPMGALHHRLHSGRQPMEATHWPGHAQNARRNAGERPAESTLLI